MQPASPGGPSWTREAERALHRRLLDRDSTAPSELAERYLYPLTQWLARVFPHVDPDLRADVATDLLLGLGERPEQYNPDKRDLFGFLQMAARSDIKNALRSQQRRTARQTPLADVEYMLETGKYGVDVGTDPAVVMDQHMSVDHNRLADLRKHFSREEWIVLMMYMDKVRDHAEYAAVLGLADAPLDEQRRKIKQIKDRAIKRFKRLGKTIWSDD